MTRRNLWAEQLAMNTHYLVYCGNDVTSLHVRRTPKSISLRSTRVAGVDVDVTNTTSWRQHFCYGFLVQFSCAFRCTARAFHRNSLIRAMSVHDIYGSTINGVIAFQLWKRLALKWRFQMRHDRNTWKSDAFNTCSKKIRPVQCSTASKFHTWQYY